MSRVGSRLLRSVCEARAYARGETTEGFIVHDPEFAAQMEAFEEVFREDRDILSALAKR